MGVLIIIGVVGYTDDVVGVMGFLFPLALRPVGLVSGRAHFLNTAFCFAFFRQNIYSPTLSFSI